MARVLVATVPMTGHVRPMAALVRALADRGHRVAWLAGRKFAPLVEAAGAAFRPLGDTDWDDADVEAAFPALRSRRGLGRIKAQLDALFIAPAPRQLRELEEACEAFAPDVLLADQAQLGAALLHEKHGVPWAGLGVSALGVPSLDTAPFGSALPPARDERDRSRNRFLNALILRGLFAGTNRAWRRARAAAGLPASEGTYFEVLSPQLYLQPTVPGFEYPRADLPPQVHFIGPLWPRAAPQAQALPAWWTDVEAMHGAGVPVVLVTQGTLATDVRELIVPALRALAQEELLVVATAASADAAAALGGELPANARLAPFIPYPALLPLLSAVVSNGGYGGVQQALAHGLPLVVAGGSEEKPEIAARVAWSGAGINLRTGRPKPRALLQAVQQVLTQPGFRARARALADEMVAFDAPTLGAGLVERLASTRAPVLRLAA
ncbi:glycosyltransferase [Azohydromonas caseinilytica]|uniref:Glycosyltransferase n=1 Tax=Azohydromonas caseinilytica TaxID=2728836 RepID=A0A848FDJ4_9BURK|nr:nucleotide disphospho-sugar-binding domain-containing protein [Azohydromonas caseinilytica]NML16459.1 glycosyltransferase [Azohydromonas caseinilytica]